MMSLLPAEPGLQRKLRRILLVEDDPSSARALRAILHRRGWHVDVASTLAEGMDALEHGPEWVVLDLMLPDGDGEAILRAIRSSGEPSRVVVITAVNDPDRLERVRELGPEALLHKPLDVARLLHQIGSLS